MFDYLKLTRDPKRVSKSLVLSNGSYKATERIRILIPKRYMDVNLMSISTTVKTLGVFITITDDNKYALATIPLTLELAPNKLETVDVVGKEFFLLYFEKDSTVIVTEKLIKHTDFVFALLDEFIIKGHLAFYKKYEDVPNLFSLVSKYTGSNVAEDISSITLLMSIVARHPDNTFFREDTSKPLKMVGLNDPINRYHDTFSKLSSNYLKKGVMTAITRPEKEGTIHTEVYTH